MNKQINKLLILLLAIFTLSGCGNNSSETKKQTNNHKEKIVYKSDELKPIVKTKKNILLDDIPNYSGNAYVEINNNEPFFTKDEITNKSFEHYSDLDAFGRCGPATASIGKDLMPNKDRESISSVKPAGWKLVKYDCVDGKYLYNRCHLIGYQLTGENANDKNLITGTRSLNINGMLPFEEKVAEYVKSTNNHVMYRVTPMYEGTNLLATGVLMEGLSVEDNGKGIKFNIFAYNQEPGININLQNGDNSSTTCQQLPTHGRTKVTSANQANHSKTGHGVIRGNRRSHVYHVPGQKDYENMSNSKYLVIFNNEQEAIDSGYKKASR